MENLENMKDKKNIEAGIVLFNPEISRLKKNIESIINQVENIVLFDNGSSNINDVKKLLSKYANVVLLKSSKNIGIAAALNKIFEYAHGKLNGSYILTLDQDSICPSNLIQEYLKYFDRSVGIYTPMIKDINANKFLATSSNKTDLVKECITSAALTSYEAWHDVNGFDESMFIDCVDFDFCNRIRLKGYKILRVNSVFLNHEIGHIKTYNVLFGKIMVKNHNSFRKYYIARNTIYMARKSKSGFKIFLSYLRILKQIVLVLFFETDKLKKIKSLVDGLREGSRVRILEKWS